MARVTDFGRFISRDVVVSADALLAPLPADCMTECSTGYFALDDDRALPADLTAFLASGEPPVYWGFGSMPDANPPRTLRVLEELSRDRRFVMLNRRASSLCTTPLPNVFWVDAVPHQALFPRVAAVLHHGGAGTTHAAARAGVPQIIVPHLLDQYYWAHQVQRLGIGVAAGSARRLSAATLAKAMAQVAPDRAPHKAAATLAESLRASAETSLQEAVRHLEGAARDARTTPQVTVARPS